MSGYDIVCGLDLKAKLLLLAKVFLVESKAVLTSRSLTKSQRRRTTDAPLATFHVFVVVSVDDRLIASGRSVAPADRKVPAPGSLLGLP
jgi:hypothetical protein